MSWEMFDGHMFEAVYRVAAEWEVRVRQQKIRIRIFADRNGRFHYQSHISAKGTGDKRIYTSPKSYNSQEEALHFAVKEINERRS